mgnify:CR=1 FL=1|tara:strand:+ start:2538 stop:5735 length:3198 start_codon:yes stop_codon:yes gene_type:complete
MTITSNAYTGDGTTVLFTFSWPYLEKDDVFVQINDDIQARPTAWDFANTNTVEFVTAPPAGARVSIYRRTNVDDLYYTFYPGSTIKAKSLNNDFEQTLFVAQESQNQYLDVETGGDIAGDVNFNGDVVFNKSVTINQYPTADTDAANKLYVDTQDQAVQAWATNEFVDASGDQMSGQLDMTNNKIVRLANPQDSSDAVNKQYVDGILVGSGGNISSLPVVRYFLTAVGGETVINPEAPIAPGNEIVTVNGSTLTPSDDYSINGTESIALRQPLLADDQVMILSYNSLKVVEVSANFDTLPYTRWVDNADAGQTVFTGTGIGTLPLAYSPGFESVFLNGALLTRDVGYVANDKVSITLSQPALVGDVVDIHSCNYIQTDSTSAVGVLYTYPGGVEQTVQQRLEQYVSVKDFGAKGDGVTDDTAAIQAAVNSNRSISLPEGTYKVTATINASRLNLTGEDAVIKGFDGVGFLVTKSVNLSGSLRFEDFADLSDLEGQRYNLTTTAIRLAPNSTIEWVRIDRGISFYQCRSGVWIADDTKEIASDLSSTCGSKEQPSWIYSSHDRGVTPVRIDCPSYNVEVAHGSYTNIIGKARVLACVRLFIDGDLTGAGINQEQWDAMGGHNIHNLYFDTVIQRTTTGDSSTGNSFALNGVILSCNNHNVHDIVAKDVNGVNYDNELLYFKGRYITINNINAQNCSDNQGVICLKGSHPDDSTKINKGGSTNISNVRASWDKTTFDNNGTTVTYKGLVGIDVEVPVDVHVSDCTFIGGGMGVLVNCTPFHNKECVFDNINVVNQTFSQPGLRIRGVASDITARVNRINPTPSVLSGSPVIFVLEDVNGRDNNNVPGSYDFSGSKLVADGSAASYLSLVSVSNKVDSDAPGIGFLRINNCSIEDTSKTIAYIFCLYQTGSANPGKTNILQRSEILNFDVIGSLNNQIGPRESSNMPTNALEFSSVANKYIATDNTQKTVFSISVLDGEELKLLIPYSIYDSTNSVGAIGTLSKLFANSGGTITEVVDAPEREGTAASSLSINTAISGEKVSVRVNGDSNTTASFNYSIGTFLTNYKL